LETIYWRTLIEVVNTGSISEAAGRMFVTPSAASRRIKYLEDAYGCPLLDRSGPVLKPTDAGRLVLEKTAGILAIETDLTAALRGVGEKRCLSFCCTPGFGIAYLPAILKNFMLADARSDDLNILVGTPDDVARRLNDRFADIAVVEHGNITIAKGYRKHPLPDEEMVFISAPGTAIDDVAADLERLTPHRLFTRVDRCCSSICLEENLRRLGVDIGRFNGIAKCDDLHLIIRAVEDGAGVAYISKNVVEGQLKEGTLRAHYVNGFVHRFRRTLAVREGALPDGRCAVFANAVLSVFGMEGLRV